MYIYLLYDSTNSPQYLKLSITDKKIDFAWYKNQELPVVILKNNVPNYSPSVEAWYFSKALKKEET